VLRGHANVLSSAIFSVDGKLIVSVGDDELVQVWEAHTGQLLQRIRRHVGPVANVVFATDSLLITSGFEDDQMIFWNVTIAPESTTQLGRHIADRLPEALRSRDR
jgi:WD40 repeat protein